MTKKLDSINRTGKIQFGSGSLTISDTGARPDTTDWVKRKAWERDLKKDVFKRIIQQLNRLGWVVGPQTYIFTDNNNRLCQKGELYADLQLSYSAITLQFYQNVVAPDRPDNGGRYQSNQEKHMPYLLRLEMDRTRNRIATYLCNVFPGYSRVADNYRSRLPAIEWIKDRFQTNSFESPNLLGRNSGEDSPYNCQSGDNGVIKHGEPVWFTDSKGRFWHGTAYYNCNNMWWVAVDKYTVTNIANFELYVFEPENLRIKRNTQLRRNRLESELSRATQGMRFEQAAILRDIIYLPGEPLFVVWHKGHKLYHKPGFNGYSASFTDAGKFTAVEVEGWNEGQNEARPISDFQKLAA